MGQSGWKWFKFTYVCMEKWNRNLVIIMTFFTSEYECKLDAKGRLILPSRIKSQVPTEGSSEFVIRKGFELCLILNPMVEFRKVFEKISTLNEFNTEHRKLQRNFLSGVMVVELDGNGRLLIPKSLLTYAEIDKEVILIGTGNKVELWNPTAYNNQKISDAVELSQLAEKYLKEN